MKKSIFKISLLVSLFLSTLFAEAQIEKGMKLFTTSASFSNTNTSSSDSTYLGVTTTGNKGYGFSLNPRIGFFVSDKFCIGIAVPVSYSSGNGFSNNNSFNSSEKNHSYSYGLSPYVRYYKRFANNFYGFLNGSINVALSNSRNYSFNSNSNPYTTTTDKTLGTKCFAGLNFGLTYFVSPKFALETSIIGATMGYNHSSQTEEGNYSYSKKSSGFSTSLVPIGFNLGLSYYFK